MGCCCGNENINVNENYRNNNNNSEENSLTENNESNSNNIKINKENKINKKNKFEELSTDNNNLQNNIENNIKLQFISESKINNSNFEYKKKNNTTNNNNENNNDNNSENGYEINDNFKFISLTIKAEYFSKETLLPIWINKGEFAKFLVKGKWRMGPNFPLTDSSGIPTSYSINFNYGSLLGRIGQENCFLIKDGTIQESKNGGQLSLRMNLPKNKTNINPSGSLNIKIFDGIVMNQNEINKKIGWLEMSILSQNKNFNKLEQLIINNLNNLRMNPVLFYEKNIETYKNMILTKEFLLNLKFNDKRRPFKIYERSIKKVKDYFENKFDKKNFIKNINKISVSAALEKIEKKLDFYLEDNLNTSNYILNCKFSKSNDPMEICLFFLFDEEIREYIFHINFLRISLNVINNFFYEDNLIVLVLYKGYN